ncbi:hypothetical protein GCM10011506_19290 [Marivirga lumbricoides]|uniref:Lipocalin-like domain-containing protein n=1 Tax=Marivirga lumbricoides TaxID=1046115 RepID=A0ABQ1M5B4_9BACT|nr:hypothetical protein GCM10011506_19290 [Marivirga lumbricoides]
MKKLTSALSLLLLFSIWCACSEDDGVSKTSLGTYQLTAIYSDPGDGSGDFAPVESNKRITLYQDSTFAANFSLCNGLSIEDTGSTEGTFSSAELSFKADCNNSLPSNELRIDLFESELIIYYSCYEGCSEKYSRINE